MLLGVPKKRIWQLGWASLSSSAMATAGYMWPPVPPAAKSTRRFSPETASSWAVMVFSLDCFSDRQLRIFKLLPFKTEYEREKERACLGLEDERLWNGVGSFGVRTR